MTAMGRSPVTQPTAPYHNLGISGIRYGMLLSSRLISSERKPQI